MPWISLAGDIVRAPARIDAATMVLESLTAIACAGHDIALELNNTAGFDRAADWLEAKF
ncbi:hypothetical protein ACFVWG_38930 [Kribbella sp. NPDC058245]|uniref:hypothetical protein n=1 Tax=Kribbella sp. NPDC058245 TaxID=3346399 RepID=UPI0036ECF8ED